MQLWPVPGGPQTMQLSPAAQPVVRQSVTGAAQVPWLETSVPAAWATQALT